MTYIHEVYNSHIVQEMVKPHFFLSHDVKEGALISLSDLFH